MTIKNVFFDFDGVILESVNVKTEAFRNLYLSHGDEIAEKVVAHHIEHGGISRYEKFKLYHQEFLNKEINKEELNKLAGNFSKLVFEGVINSPYVPGIEDFITKRSKEFRFSIISGTPTRELVKIVESIGLKSHFHEVYGSPTKKTEWANKILSENNLKRRETLFVGDAVTDWDAAQKTGLYFLLRETDECIEFFKDYSGPRIRDFKRFDELLKEYD